MGKMVCKRCSRPVDDCRCPTEAAGRTVVLFTATTPRRPVEMPASTTARYAAKRVAEAMDLDPQARDFFLIDIAREEPIPCDDVVADWDGALVLLGVPYE